MKNTLFLWVLLLLGTSCDFSTTAEEARETDPRFHLTPPSLLYFKNIRQSQYNQQEHPNDLVSVFRLRKWPESSQRAQLAPLIVINELKSEGYLFLEKNAVLDTLPEPVKIRWKKGKKQEEIPLSVSGLTEQYELAETLYDHLAAGHDLEAGNDVSGWQTLFADNTEERTAFLVTLRDYFRLIERDRRQKRSE